jgi:tRNA(His) 5'-end guanylyltransferase
MAQITTLKERIESYEDLSDYRLLPKIPVIIVLNGRSFRKCTSLLPKPFSEALTELMVATSIKLAQEIDGTALVYSFNDEIVIVSRNDRSLDINCWFDNRIQKIASAASAIATLEFNRVAKSSGIPLFGDPIFLSSVFAVPSVMEASNVILSKQQQAFHTSLYNACFYELLKNHSVDTVRQTLAEKTTQGKADILLEQCGIDFDSYPLQHRRGFVLYRRAQTVLTERGETTQTKLVVDMEVPLFVKEPDFLNGILKR